MGGFGSTINIINGGIECGGGSNKKAENRGKYYKEFLSAFGIDPSGEQHLSCATEGSFPMGGTGEALGFFQNGQDHNDVENECKLVSWQTGYSMYARDDYKRCICETWGRGEDDCPQAGDNEETEEEETEEESEEEQEESEEEQEESEEE